MPVRRIGGWTDSARRAADAAAALLLPGGARLAAFLAQVDGYLYPHEAVFLYWLARTSPGRGAIVEIGSFRGRSTLCLAAGLHDRGEGHILAVDPHVYGTEPELRENLAHFGLADRVRLEVSSSSAVAARFREPARCVFVDGDHAPAEVERDVAAWLPHLAPGGFLLLHDSTRLSGFRGPQEVARERLRRGPLFAQTGAIGSISWGRIAGGPRYPVRQFGRRPIDALLGGVRHIRRAVGRSG